MDSEFARVGDTVTATVSNVPDGTRVELSFDGEIVASGTARSPSSSNVEAEAAGTAVIFNSGQVVAQVRDASITLQFEVPDRPAGEYRLLAIGPGFTVSCTPGESFEVLGAAAGPGGGGTTGDGSGSGDGSRGEGARTGSNLPRTGADGAIPLSRLALALVALGAGMWLLADRRRSHRSVPA